MNLSKIAVGVAVSLCLVSNIALAESSSSSSSSSSSAATAPAATAPAATAPKNTYTKTLEEKAQEKFDELYQKLELEKLDEMGKGPLEFEGERLQELFDAYGYGVSILRLDRIKNHPRGFPQYYPLKLLNDEINENKEQLDKNLEGLKIATDTINKVSSQKASIEAVQKNTTNIAENKKAIDTNKTKIDANKTKIDANKSSIDKNVKAISDMNAKIELNHKSIQDAKSQLNARLNNLNKDLRRGLATQSALTGLFQPYSVGKMNVTAAVGGYQSEKAIAVGSGYRFNDNLAAKVGLSKSLGGSAVSYNMGVNYEF